VIRTSPDFLTTFEIGLVEGDYYSEERDTLNYGYVVVNQSLVNFMGWKDPVGRKMYLWGGDRTILGVTEDIKFYPFQMQGFSNEALIYVYEPVQNYIFVRVDPGISSKQLTGIVDVFHKYNPGYEVEYDYVSNYDYAMLENSDAISLVFTRKFRCDFAGLQVFLCSSHIYCHHGADRTFTI